MQCEKQLQECPQTPASSREQQGYGWGMLGAASTPLLPCPNLLARLLLPALPPSTTLLPSDGGPQLLEHDSAAHSCTSGAPLFL